MSGTIGTDPYDPLSGSLATTPAAGTVPASTTGVGTAADGSSSAASTGADTSGTMAGGTSGATGAGTTAATGMAGGATGAGMGAGGSGGTPTDVIAGPPGPTGGTSGAGTTATTTIGPAEGTAGAGGATGGGTQTDVIAGPAGPADETTAGAAAGSGGASTDDASADESAAGPVGTPAGAEAPTGAADGMPDQTFFALFTPENNSGGLGIGRLSLDGNTVTLDVVATGLTPGQTHPFHLHAFTDGRTERLPTVADDANGDGLIQTAEAAATAYGPVLLPFTVDGDDGAGAFPTADANGRLTYSRSIALDPSDEGDAAILAELSERTEGRVLNLHGLDLGDLGVVGRELMLAMPPLLDDAASGGAGGVEDTAGGGTAGGDAAGGDAGGAQGTTGGGADDDAGDDADADVPEAEDASSAVALEAASGTTGAQEDAGGTAGGAAGGATGAQGGASTDTAGYDANLPVAAAVLLPVPEDADASITALAEADSATFLARAEAALAALAPYTLDPTGGGPLAPETTPPQEGDDADTFLALLAPANNSGAFGAAAVRIDEAAGTVEVRLVAEGLTPDRMHAAHIHGFADDRPSLLPNFTLDADRDGFVEDQEGAPALGPVILGFTRSGAISDAALTARFPRAGDDGTVTLEQTYRFNLQNPVQAALFEELTDRLGGRAVQIHGLELTNAEHGAGTGGEVNGEAGFVPELPVANGILLPVDEGNPAAQDMLTIASALFGEDLLFGT